MRPTTFAVLALVLAVSLAGCGDKPKAQSDDVRSTTTSTTSGPRDGGTGTTTSTTTTTAQPVTNGTSPGNNATNSTGNATGNQTGNATGNTTWRYDNRTGTIAGTAIPFIAASAEETETIAVGDSALNLTLNLTSTGDAVTMTIVPPGCDADECQTEIEAEDGRADIGFDDPTPGNWNVTLSVGGIGSVSADYELTVAQLVPGNATA